MRHYVTLFDSAYATKGTLMLHSLAEVSGGQYECVVIALDDHVAAMRLPHATVVPYRDLEAAVPELAEVRRTRTHREWCWTLASAALRWRLGQVAPDEVVTYLDADLAFFSDPAAAFAELGDRSIGIVPHRFAPIYQHYEPTSGRFNVSWVSLRRDAVGTACAEEWSRQVLAHCAEDDCGDQRYLDAWPAQYGDNLHVFQSPGMGVAPWNVFAYEIGEGPTVDGQPVVFYHYHELQETTEPAHGFERRGNALFLDGFRLTLGYPLRPVDVETFYRRYCADYRAEAG